MDATALIRTHYMAKVRDCFHDTLCESPSWQFCGTVSCQPWKSKQQWCVLPAYGKGNVTKKSRQPGRAKSLSPTTKKNQILPTTTQAWMKAASSRWEHSPADTLSVAGETLSRGASYQCPDSSLTGLWHNKCVLCHQIYGNLLPNDRKLMLYTILKALNHLF